MHLSVKREYYFFLDLIEKMSKKRVPQFKVCQKQILRQKIMGQIT